MGTILQILQIFLTTVFIILTLGYVSVEIEWTDGSRFKYKGWGERK